MYAYAWCLRVCQATCCWYIPWKWQGPSSCLLHSPVLPSLPLRVHALGQLLLRLGQWVEKLGHSFGTCFLWLLNVVSFFLMLVGVDRGTFKTSTKIHSGLSVVCYFVFCAFSSCCSFVFPFEYCLLMGFSQGLVLATLFIHLSPKCLLQWRLLAAETSPTHCSSEEHYLWHLAFS